MSHKSLVVGARLGLMAGIILAMLLTVYIMIQQAVNPFAAFVAAVVAVVGIVWYKKAIG